jgi:transglycosylase-like protein with SLT domain/sporulation related protein
MRACARAVAALLMLTGVCLPAMAQESPAESSQGEPGDAAPAAPADARESVCLMVESAARANDLPLDFFARVIWQESRFQPQAVGPRTRSGGRAQGIAQFMPGTAAERRLLDPFDPVQALPKSAEFLHELRGQFGNLGLAAAAYNAGPQRVRAWLAGSRPLPAETRHYVLAVTGAPADDWAKGPDASRRATARTASDCRSLMALLRQAPNLFVERLEQRVELVAASPWGVQLSAGFSRDGALAAYARLAKRYAEVLSGHDPSLLSATLRSRGTRAFYQVRAGAETRQGADELCNKIRRAGGACLVLRNPNAA